MDNVSRMLMMGGLKDTPPGQIQFVTQGAHSWVVPPGVTRISAVIVGNGGTQVPYGTEGVKSGPTVFKRNGAVIMEAQAGADGSSIEEHRATGSGGSGGGSGGLGNFGTGGYPGGGGAGGYSGVGGRGFINQSPTSENNGAGGGGGGGAGGLNNAAWIGYGAGGGGVGLLGSGANGAAGSRPTGSALGGPGGGGSGGTAGTNSLNGGRGGLYGGGGGAISAPSWVSGGGGALRYINNMSVLPGDIISIDIPTRGTLNGGRGAARIIWPGDERRFPSTRTGDE